MYKGKKVLLRCHCEEDIEKLHEFINDYEVKKIFRSWNSTSINKVARIGMGEKEKI